MSRDAWLTSERSLERYHDALQRVEYEQLVCEAKAAQRSQTTPSRRLGIAGYLAALITLWASVFRC